MAAPAPTLRPWSTCWLAASGGSSRASGIASARSPRPRRSPEVSARRGERRNLDPGTRRVGGGQRLDLARRIHRRSSPRDGPGVRPSVPSHHRARRGGNDDRLDRGDRRRAGQPRRGRAVSARRDQQRVRWPLGRPGVCVDSSAAECFPVGRARSISGDIQEAVSVALRAAGGRNLLVLGAEVARQCLDAALVDEILLRVLPILIGDGIRLFGRRRHEEMLIRTETVDRAGEAAVLLLRRSR